MRPLLAHLILTLRLNFRAHQALVYGYLVPIFFLLAFGSVFHSSVPPLLHEMGQLVTITILGGACFGMPTGMVSERERGIWRRYRLLPAATAGLVVSAMVARYLIVLLAVVMQFGLAWCLYRTPLPAHSFSFLVAFTAVCFAFLGMGLVIAMLAGAVPAVQALGQAIFLPMIMIGGVGVPLRILPPWAQIFAGFLPGRYAVEALDASYLPDGLGLAGSRFAIVALIVIGAAACLAGSRMFRWDSGQKLAPRAKAWIAFALAAWAVVGLVAIRTGHLNVPTANNWQAVTLAQINAIPFSDLPRDDSVVTPIAPGIDNLSPPSKTRVMDIRARLATWPLARDPDPVQRVRNLLSAASVFDILEDPDEGPIAYVILDDTRRQYPPADLERILTYIILHPGEGAVLTKVPALGGHDEVTEAASRERTVIYSEKLLKRLIGK
jgi:ABC-2 type transport system permease protein